MKRKKKLILLIIVIIPVLLLITYLGLEKSTLLTSTTDEVKSPQLEGFQALAEQIDHKNFELDKPTLLYDGSRLTIHDILMYQPSQIVRESSSDNSKYLAVALDVEFDIDRKKVVSSFESTDGQRLWYYTENQDEVSQYFRDGDINLGVKAHNSTSMKWLIQELPDEMRLIDTEVVSSLLPHYVRMAHEEESAQPNLFAIFREKESKIFDAHDFNNYPRNIRGWVTYIFKIEDWAENEKVDYKYGENLVLKYKNGSQGLKELLIESGKLSNR